MANSGCHCLCPGNHRDQPGICEGGEDLRIVYRVPSAIVDLTGGTVDVPMCSACAAATLVERRKQ